MSKQLSSTIVILAAAALAQLVYGYDSAAYKDPHYVGNRTTMVQLFEWKWKDIAVECEKFLGPMGYGGVQVSPINENLIMPNRPWIERYEPMSYEIITRSGNKDELKDMVARCNAVGVRIYVDVVINRMSVFTDRAIGTGGSTADTRNFWYNNITFHPGDFNMQSDIEADKDGKLGRLHDLNLSKRGVRWNIVYLLNTAIRLGVAGFRVDGAKHIVPSDLKAIYESVEDLRSDIFGEHQRPFIFQDVITWGGYPRFSRSEYTSLGCIVLLSTGNSFDKVYTVQTDNEGLVRWGLNLTGLPPTSDVVVMIDNHEFQRKFTTNGRVMLSFENPRLYKVAVAFMLAHPYGHPRVMSSFNFTDWGDGPPADASENIVSPDAISGNVTDVADANPCGHGWVCEHRWPQIYGMVGFRNVVQNATLVNWWSNDRNQNAFSRGNLGFVAFNGQYGVDLKAKLQTGLQPGNYCDVISGRKVNGMCTGKTVEVEGDGNAYIEILKDEDDGVLAIYTKTKL